MKDTCTANHGITDHLYFCSKARVPNNSVKDIVNHLTNVQNFLTETQILEDVFCYRRGPYQDSNKKYADMLRRGVAKGIILRADVKLGRSRYVYYVNVG